MPRHAPHPLALFSLLGDNECTKNVIRHPSNSHMVYLDEQGNCQYAIDIGFHIKSKSRYTLATIGRADADVTIEAENVSRTQCSFEIVADSGTIMVYDRSTSQSTRFRGPDAMSFERGRHPRRVVIQPGVNSLLCFGGPNCDLYQFKIFWHKNVINIKHEAEMQRDIPCFARTIDDTETAVPSHRANRTYTPQTPVRKIRYVLGQPLGNGAFGVVRRAVNVDSGLQMALKSLPWPKLHDVDPQAQRDLQVLKREVDFLKSMVHRHIVEYIGAQKSEDEKTIEIFTLQKDGSIDDLISKEVFQNTKEAHCLFHQMLQAIDFLASRDVIHRDVKPANILFSSSDTGYRYQLTDFGISNQASAASTFTGTPCYMAPELWDSRNSRQSSRQSPKMDVWSLLVTIMQAVDLPPGFRAEFQRAAAGGLHPTQMSQVQKLVRNAAESHFYYRIKDMANVDPSKRTSAGDVIDAVYNGEGRTTKRIASVIGPTTQLGATDGRQVRVERPSVQKPSLALPTSIRKTSTLLQRRQSRARTETLQRQVHLMSQGLFQPQGKKL